MSIIVTRAGKGAALTFNEADANFTNLNADKYEAGSAAQFASLSLAAALPVSSGGTGVTSSTGSGSVVLSTSPTLVSPALGAPISGDFSTGTFTWPTFNQNTTGSAAKWTTARTLAGNAVDGSANVAFANKFIVQGTTDTGLSGAQFLGALGTGIVKNTTTTGVLSIAGAADFPTLNQNTTGTAAGLSATLVATSGGTGQSSYAVGDLLYASTTTALSKLADVATGNALISGGVGVAPSYGKIGLTTHVSGTLPVANGGTGTSTAFTTGSVLFAGASGVYAQDNANLFWDNTNNRLGIGTTTPSTKVDAKNTTTGSAIRATVTDGAGSSDFGYGFYIDNTAHEIAAVNAVYTTSASGGSGALTFKYRNAGTLAEGMRLNQLGNVGIGSASPTVKLDVTGAAAFSTSATTPIVYGGTGTTSTLSLRATSGVGTTNSDIIFGVGNNGAVEAMRLYSTGQASIANSNMSGAALSSANPAKLHLPPITYTDTATPASTTQAIAPVVAIRSSTIAATNTAVTYNDAASLYLSGAPIAGTNVTLGNSYALFINAGQFRFPGDARKSIVTTYTDSIGDVYGMEQVSSAQSGTNAALRLFCSSQASSVIAFGKYTSATAFTEFGRFDNNGNVGIGTSTNLSTLTVNGPIALKAPSTVNAATYTVAATDSSLRFTTTNCTVTLPAAASFPGRILYLNTITANSVISASSNVIPLGSNTAGTAILAATAGKFTMIQSDGTNWITMMSN